MPSITATAPTTIKTLSSILIYLAFLFLYLTVFRTIHAIISLVLFLPKSFFVDKLSAPLFQFVVPIF